jgi:hypothetical protein
MSDVLRVLRVVIDPLVYFLTHSGPLRVLRLLLSVD